MRSALATFLGAIFLFTIIAAYTQLVANSRYLTLSSAVLRDWAAQVPLVADPEVLMKETKAKAEHYDNLIIADHLVDGMLVNTTLNGRMLDHCDSLLFSSLRFVGLNKLGLDDRAADAWHGIEQSRNASGWLRHPQCPEIGTSRDMLLGLLIAIAQEPAGFDRHLKALIGQIDQNGGYFSTGPMYVSYLTPGIARLIGMLAPTSNLAEHDLPLIIQRSYATHEFTLYGTSQGYQAHLVALNVWLEMELNARHPGIRQQLSGIPRQRLEWTTQQLVQLDNTNLFFRYLRLRAGGALSRPVAAGLMHELLAMPQFPDDRLPNNCDRRADYLWQRSSREFASTSRICNKEFHGADFLWMAGLLTEALTSKDQAAVSH